MNTTYYFSYGSYMSPEKMKKSIPEAILIGPGRLNGYRLTFTAYSELRKRVGADILPSTQHEVWGLVYKIPAERIAEMDANKAYPALYNRFEVFIDIGSETYIAWTYALVNKQDSGQLPTEDYLMLVRSLAEAQGFPETYVQSFLS
ncbi:MAG: gamma-glutamylcyclotransferase family protein [Siphonobacter sp.]